MPPPPKGRTSCRQLLLASSSRYRRSQLERLQLPFEWSAPDIDETPRRDESPEALVERLSRAKAAAVAADWPDYVVIAGDQVAVLDNEVLGKPGSHVTAVEQLSRASGRAVTFLSGLYVADGRSGADAFRIVPVEVEFRTLTQAEIERYVAVDQPFDCAGSIRSESLGPAICAAIRSDDPSALLGLPLIALCRYLTRFGISPLQE